MNEASSSGSSRKESVVVDVGRRRSPCGYCKSGSRSSVTYGLWAHNLTVQDYQDLLDQGWRRSGCFLYKPEMETTCCPSYTIRLRAEDFVPSKEQVRVRRRMERYLDGTLDVKKQNKHAEIASGNIEASSGCSEPISSANQNEDKSQEEILMINLSEKIDKAIQSCVVSGELPVDIEFPNGLVKKILLTKKRRLADGFEDLLYTSNISFQIVAALKRVKSTQNDSPQIIAERIAHFMQNLVETPDLTVRACNGHINFYSSLKQDDSSVACSKSKEHKKGIEEPLTKKRKFEIHMKRSTFDPVEFALYKKYQMVVHNDKESKVTESSYKRFLVDSPLIYVPPTTDVTVPPCGFGSFHQQYLIDGKLIAVGVVDILPKCLSSKYLFWDPDYAFLSLGKFSALKEIECVKVNSHLCPSLEYYYLGYYIHSCNKMRYKASYRPSELLCPLRYQWVPFSTAKPMLDRRKYSVLSDTSGSSSLPEPETPTEEVDDELHNGDSNDIHVQGVDNSDSESSDDDDDDELLPDTNSSPTEAYNVGNTLVSLNGYRLKYKDLQRVLVPAQRDQLESQLRRYIKVVGSQLAERMASVLDLRKALPPVVSLRWVPFSTAKPMLDRRKYSVLPDTSGSSLPAPETPTEEVDDDLQNGDSNDSHVEGVNEVLDSDSESSDDEQLPDTKSSLTEAYDVGNTLVSLNGYRLKYKRARVGETRPKLIAHRAQLVTSFLFSIESPPRTTIDYDMDYPEHVETTTNEADDDEEEDSSMFEQMTAEDIMRKFDY